MLGFSWEWFEGVTVGGALSDTYGVRAGWEAAHPSTVSRKALSLQLLAPCLCCSISSGAQWWLAPGKPHLCSWEIPEVRWQTRHALQGVSNDWHCALGAAGAWISFPANMSGCVHRLESHLDQVLNWCAPNPAPYITLSVGKECKKCTDFWSRES